MGLFSMGLQGMLFTIFARLLVLFTAMPVHEFAHGWVAYKLGDDTASYRGRLDFNPLAHLDPFGSLLLVLTGFGWAKPVPVNPRNFSRKISMRGGMALTSLAGPVANILLAFVILLVARILDVLLMIVGIHITFMSVLMQILVMMVQINVGLAVFNLLPIPPLDGYNIVSYFIPARWEYKIAAYSQYIFIGLMFLMFFTNILSGPLSLLSGLIFKLLDFSTGFVYLIAKLFI